MTVYVAVIEKEHILAKDIKPIMKIIDAVSAKEKDPFQKIAVTFSGYDDTSVEVWETPEVRQWAHRLINKVPYLFYYIENEYYQTQQTLMMCMNDIETVFEGPRLSPIERSALGQSYDELPRHKVKIHVHKKSMHEMFSEIRKHAKSSGKAANATKLISEMSKRYAIGEEEE